VIFARKNSQVGPGVGAVIPPTRSALGMVRPAKVVCAVASTPDGRSRGGPSGAHQRSMDALPTFPSASVRTLTSSLPWVDVNLPRTTSRVGSVRPACYAEAGGGNDAFHRQSPGGGSGHIGSGCGDDGDDPEELPSHLTDAVGVVVEAATGQPADGSCRGPVVAVPGRDELVGLEVAPNASKAELAVHGQVHCPADRKSRRNRLAQPALECLGLVVQGIWIKNPQGRALVGYR